MAKSLAWNEAKQAEAGGISIRNGCSARQGRGCGRTGVRVDVRTRTSQHWSWPWKARKRFLAISAGLPGNNTPADFQCKLRRATPVLTNAQAKQRLCKVHHRPSWLIALETLMRVKAVTRRSVVQGRYAVEG